MGNEASIQLPKAEPTRLITFPQKEDVEEGDIPSIYLEKVEELMGVDEEIKCKKFFVISVTGVYRSGKSFLLNLLQTYLDHYAKMGTDDKWEKKAGWIEGGNWAQSTESVTHGIWMWNRGFLINDVVIVLIDCQGTGDSKKSSPTLDNLILYLGLQLANVQIMNLKGVLESRDLERIDMCKHFSDLASEGTLFDSALVYLCRDWNGDNKFGRKEMHFQSIADNAESTVVRDFAVGIQKTFSEVTTFALPPPGEKILRGSDGEQLKMEDVNKEFLVAAKELFQYLCVELPKSRSHSLLNGEKLLHNFKELKRRIVKLGNIKILSSRDYFIETMISNAFEAAHLFHDQEMQKLTQQEYGMDSGQIIQELNRILNDTVAMFQRDKCVVQHANSEHAVRYLERLRDKQKHIDEKAELLAQAKRLEERENEVKKYQLEKEKLEKENKESKKALEAERKLGSINQEEYQKQVALLEKRNEKKLNELLEDERNKREELDSEIDSLREKFEALQRRQEEDGERGDSVLAQIGKGLVMIGKGIASGVATLVKRIKI